MRLDYDPDGSIPALVPLIVTVSLVDADGAPVFDEDGWLRLEADESVTAAIQPLVEEFPGRQRRGVVDLFGEDPGGEPKSIASGRALLLPAVTEDFS